MIAAMRAAPQVLAPSQVRKGFMAAIEAMEDLRLDVPDVVDQLALFICRWVLCLWSLRSGMSCTSAVVDSSSLEQPSFCGPACGQTHCRAA
jgi:hypothetical protein